MEVQELLSNGYKHYHSDHDYNCGGLFQKPIFDFEDNLKYHVDIYLWSFPTHSYFELKTQLLLDRSKEFFTFISFNCTKHSLNFVEDFTEKVYTRLECIPLELKNER